MNPHQVWVVSAHENGTEVYGFAFTDSVDATKLFKEGKRRYRRLKWFIQSFPLDVFKRAEYHLDILKFRERMKP